MVSITSTTVPLPHGLSAPKPIGCGQRQHLLPTDGQQYSWDETNQVWTTERLF